LTPRLLIALNYATSMQLLAFVDSITARFNLPLTRRSHSFVDEGFPRF
jgi:hypothetical protein